MLRLLIKTPAVNHQEKEGLPVKRMLAVLLIALLIISGCSYKPKVIPIETLSPTNMPGAQTPPPGGADPAQTGDIPSQPTPYQREVESGMTLAERFNPPEGYSRNYAADGSMTAFLRGYALKAAGAELKKHDGSTRTDAGEAAVLQVSLSDKNHEGPAGAMARLIAEYFYHESRYEKISFTLGSQFDFNFDRWSEGKLLSVNGNSIKYVSGGTSGTGADNFDKFLQVLFHYISVDTLKKDMTLVADPDTDAIRVGDIFIGADSAGKTACAMVVDLSTDDVTGKQIMLLAQGGAPAQELHIVKNTGNADLSPWYDCGFAMELKTPDATYDIESRYRFADIS